MVGACRKRLWPVFFCGNCGRVTDGAVGKGEENPDDAALVKKDIGLTPPWPFICHAQFENLGEETPSILCLD